MSALMQVYEKADACCGCSACEQICPSRAIAMLPDEKGFLYPVIDRGLCVGCGRCVSVCQIKEEPERRESRAIYAVKHPDKTIVKNSSSGGAFTLLSDLVLNEGGVVFGCIIDDDFNVIHTMAQTPEERDRMRGSKYVQSDMRDIYTQVKQNCRERKTLFVGTPCQVAGLYAYLGEKPDNLITVDFLCHGTPSAKLLVDHVRFLEEKYRKQAVSYKFRDKKYGWRHVETICFKDGTQRSGYDTFRLKYLFGSNLDLRPSCYQCTYARQERVSDITIGDFWGAEKKLRDYSNTGVSLAMLNTEKGRQLFSALKDRGVLAPCSLEEIMQRTLRSAAPKSDRVETFWDTYLKKGYVGATEVFSDSRKKHYLRFAFVAITVKLHLDPLINRTKTFVRKRLKHG